MLRDLPVKHISLDFGSAAVLIQTKRRWTSLQSMTYCIAGLAVVRCRLSKTHFARQHSKHRADTQALHGTGIMLLSHCSRELPISSQIST